MKMNSSELIEKLSRENENLRLLIELLMDNPDENKKTIELLMTKLSIKSK